MNFLAHVYLSGENTEIRVGNFIGDFVKGNQMEAYSLMIKNGIIMHRSIDHFTDTHPIVKKSKERLRPEFRHYAPVIVDVFYDHFLADRWSQFSSQSLKNFTTSFYEEMKSHKTNLPKDAQHMLTYMSRDNWLYNYRLTEGIRRALTGMARRTSFDSKMEHAVNHLEEHYKDFASEFEAFFPELRQHCEKYLASLKV